MATHESSASSLAILPGYQFWKVRGSPLAQRDQNGLLGELDFLRRPTQVTEVSFLVMLWMLLGLTVTRSLKQAWQGVKGFQLVGHKPERGTKYFSSCTWQCFLASSQVRFTVCRKSSCSAVLQVSIRAEQEHKYRRNRSADIHLKTNIWTRRAELTCIKSSASF